MTWLRKLKRPITAKLCASCHERRGVVLLERVDANVEGPHSVWLCAACIRALRNDPASS